MRGGLTHTHPGLLLLVLACLCAAAAPAGRVNAQEGPAASTPNPPAGTTRKVDEYGKIGHCDESARLDNFAVELQHETSSKGYLMVYVGKDDLPAWTKGILGRAASYLVNSRGLEPGRIQVVNAGYREKRATELWVVPENGLPPQPSDTIDFRPDRTRAYKWDEHSFNVGFAPDDAEVVGEEVEGDGSGEAEGEAVAADAAEAPAEAAETESAEEAEWRREEEKYEISTTTRGVFEDEPQPENPDAKEAGAGDGAADEAAAAAEPEDPPSVGEITISLWWNVERLADELKEAPEARLYLVYYWGVKNATQERVKEIIERALVKTEEQLGLKRDRINVIDGGRSADPGVEIWVVPRGAQAPRPRPEQRRSFDFYSAPGEE